MLVKYTLVIGLFLFSSNSIIVAQGQQQRPRPQNRPPASLTDQELQNKIASFADQDSLLEFYFDYSTTIVNRTPYQVLRFADAIQQDNSISELKRNAYSNVLRALYWDRPKPDSALKYLRLAELQFTELVNHERVIRLIILQARASNRISMFLESESLYYNALNYIEEQELPFEYTVNVLNEMSDLYIRLGATEFALVRLTELLEIGSDSINEECNIRLKISNARKRNQELDLAVEQLLLCTDQELENKSLQVSIYRSLSDLERLRGNQEERLKWLLKAAELNNPDPARNIPTNLFLAQAFFDNGLYAKSDSVLQIIESTDTRRVQVPTLVNLAMLKVNNSLRLGDANSALRYADEGLQYVERMPGSLIGLDLRRLKARAHEMEGNFEAAYSVLKDLEDREQLFENMGRIRQEEESKVRFQLRAANDELDEVSTQLEIVRLRTLLYVLFISGLSVFLIYRFRLLSALKVERTRIRIASDLHDEVSATLTGISYFAQAVTTQQEEERKKHFVNLIRESASEAKDKISDIVWAITPENDDWDKFLAKCRRYGSDLLDSSGMHYELKIATSIPGKLSMTIRQNLWMIYKEMLTNVVRHSGATRVDVILDTDQDGLKLIIQDNGKGFIMNQNEFGNGLKNIRKRAESIKAVIELDSEIEIGTRWKMVVKL